MHKIFFGRTASAALFFNIQNSFLIPTQFRLLFPDLSHDGMVELLQFPVVIVWKLSAKCNVKA